MKGQAEVLIILGLIVVITVVVITQLNPFNAPLSPETATAKATVEMFIKNTVSAALDNITTYGGYANPEQFPMGSVKLNGKDVPYWEYQGRIVIPDIKNNLRSAIEEQLRENKDLFLNAAVSKGILDSMGEPVVNDVQILDGAVKVTVTMPAKSKDIPLPQPFVVSVQSNLKDMKDFAESFVRDSHTRRPLEYFTLTSMVASPYDDGANEIPFMVFLTDCGDYYMRTWQDLKPKMENAIERTLGNIYMPGKAPLNTMDSTSSPKYTLLRYGGKDYSNIDVKFFTPDEFELTPSEFRFSPDPINAYAEPIPFVGYCQSDPVYVSYDLNYPAVVSVRDSQTGKALRIAVQVYIINNTPADFSSISPEETGEDVCASDYCALNIHVQDRKGNPVSEAPVSFMDCNLGRTDNSGNLIAPSPCGMGFLNVYSSGFAQYSNFTSSTFINGITVTLKKKPAITLHFFEANVINNVISKNYQIGAYEVYTLNDQHTNEMVYMDFYNVEENKAYRQIYTKNTGRVTQLPTGNYIISMTLSDNGKTVGGLLTKYTISEDLDGKDLYIYLPYSAYYSEITDTGQKTREMANLNNVLIECGLGPITETPVNYLDYQGCMVNYDEI